jgi:uncharacterized protein (DUF4415 family)
MEKSAGGQLARLSEGYSSSPTRSKKKVTRKSSASSRPEKPRSANVVRMRGRPKLDAGMRRRLEALDALPDDQIDLSDIPERTDYSGPVYIGLIPGPGKKTSITIRIDDDIVRWFRKQGKGWQTKMNWVLRLYFASHRKTGVKVGRP